MKVFKLRIVGDIGIEVWFPIEGFDNYMVSNYGRVKSLNYNHTGKEKIMATPKDGYGYCLIHLFKNRKSYAVKVHKLVALSFLPKWNLCFEQINHKDENKENNAVWNLEYCNCSYNINYGTRNVKVSQKEKNRKDASKSIIQYDLEGNFIKEWPSSKEINRQLGFNTASIYQCRIGKYKQSYGYIWKTNTELI